MKKLTEEEYQNLAVKGKGRSSQIFNSLINLKIGEALLIEKKDWARKAGPSTLVRYIEKNHNMKFSYNALGNGMGWAIKRIENETQVEVKKEQKTQKSEVQIKTVVVEAPAKNKESNNRLMLKSDIVVFYLGRMAFYKIERIEESVKACVNNFMKQDPELVRELFFEIINSLAEQGHIVIENEKTYIPLRRI